MGENIVVGLFGIFSFAFVAVLIWALYKFFRQGLTASPGSLIGVDTICIQCGSQGQAVRVNKGSGGIEALLWILVFSWPIALLYSVWRRSGKANICATCGGILIPSESPQGKQLAKKFAQ